MTWMTALKQDLAAMGLSIVKTKEIKALWKFVIATEAGDLSARFKLIESLKRASPGKTH